MNYKRIYDEIINNAKSRGLNKKLLDGYYECHHIIPKCMNGTNDKDNLVLLSALEHYICHYLLWKSNKENKSLFLAYHKISFSKTAHQKRNFKISSKQYEILRIENSKVKSFQTIGKNNPMFGRKHSESTLKLMCQNRKPVIYTDELKIKLSSAHKGKHFGSSNPMFGKTPANAKPVIVNGVKYASVNKAAAALKLTPYKVYKIIKEENYDNFG